MSLFVIDPASAAISPAESSREKIIVMYITPHFSSGYRLHIRVANNSNISASALATQRTRVRPAKSKSRPIIVMIEVKPLEPCHTCFVILYNVIEDS